MGAPPGTLTIYATGDHDHDEHAPSDAGHVFLPQHAIIAREYLSQPGPHKKKGLKTFLAARDVPPSAWPTDRQLTFWLQRNKPKVGKVDKTFSVPRQFLVERSLQQWPRQPTSTASDLFLLNDPPYICNEKRVCICFASTGMFGVMRRIQATRGAMCIDVKQGCLGHGWGVLTAALIVKDRLRNTTLGRFATNKLQALAFTSHAEPILQAVVNTEPADNVIQFLQTLVIAWSTQRPDLPPLLEWLHQVHKDFHPALEAARRAVLSLVRPVNDFFHLTQSEPTMEKKLRVVSATPGRHIKEHKAWVVHALHVQRHLPTLDLSSAIYRGFLQRLLALGESEVAAFYGPAGHATHCVEASGQHIHDVYGVSALNPDSSTRLLFVYHWSGLFGTLPGTDAGDQPLEAFHSPWAEHLASLGKDTQAAKAMELMQEVFQTWSTQLQWEAKSSLLLVPPDIDTKLLHSPLLAKVGRSTAFDFADASTTTLVHHLYEVSERLHLVIMPHSLSHTLDVHVAQSAAAMLTTSGAELHAQLRNAAVLYDVTDTQGTVHYDCVKLSQVRRHFVDQVFVFVRAEGEGPWSWYPGFLCTCSNFMRYGGCEHIEYAKTLDLPLRAATSTAAQLPVQHQRGSFTFSENNTKQKHLFLFFSG